MGEFDDKLNSLLSDPGAMDQIIKMAQSLMGSQADGGSPQGNGAGNGPPPSGSGSAQPFGGIGGTGTVQGQNGWGPGPGNAPWGPADAWNTGPVSQSGGYGGPFSGSPDQSVLSGLGNIDPQTIARLLPILRELGSGQNSNARQLLFALRPYLKPERQDKVERALQLARLFHVGKKFLLKGDRDV